MKDFQFANSKIAIYVKGRTYEVDLGDADLQQRLLEFAVALGNTNAGDIASKAYVWISDRIHEFIGILFGADAEQEIFEGKRQAIMEEIRLFVEVQAEMNNNDSSRELEALLGRFAPSETK